MKNNIGYLLGEGLKSTFKHGFMSFAAVCITVACLVIINSFLLICYNLNSMVDDLQKKNRIIAIIDEELLTHDAQSIGSEINMLDNIDKAVFITREEALAEFGGYLVDSDSIFDNENTKQYVITLTDESLLSKTKTELEGISGVTAVFDCTDEEGNVSILVVAEAFEQLVDEAVIGDAILALSNVKEAVVISGQEALERFGDMFEDGDSLYAGVDASTMRNQYQITLKDNDLISETKKEIEAIPGVVRVDANIEEANAMATVRDVIYVAAIAITAVLLIVSLVIISNTIKLAMMDRREEIAIMKMVGATNAFIRLPFVVEGFVLGLFGSMFSFFIEWGLYEILRNAIVGTGFDVVSFAPYTDIWLPMAAICVISGFVIGIFGSLMSIRRFLKV